jgi:multidrug efflux pump subunit AcrA (membrane-fusion protein)
MKKLLTVIMLTLGLNFLALAGGVGWLFKNHKLDREKIMAIKEIVFPKPAPEVPTTEPSDEPTTQPIMRLDELLAKATGRSASEQVEFIQHAFDAQMAILDRRQRELIDLQRQVDLSKEQMSKDRSALDEQKKALDAREQQATKLASDKGFQDSLALYNGMAPKQVKTIFMGLDDQTIKNYLEAMEPRTAAKIVKEFKSADETARIQKIMEQMRLAAVSTKE